MEQGARAHEEARPSFASGCCDRCTTNVHGERALLQFQDERAQSVRRHCDNVSGVDALSLARFAHPKHGGRMRRAFSKSDADTGGRSLRSILPVRRMTMHRRSRQTVLNQIRTNVHSRHTTHAQAQDDWDQHGEHTTHPNGRQYATAAVDSYNRWPGTRAGGSTALSQERHGSAGGSEKGAHQRVGRGPQSTTSSLRPARHSGIACHSRSCEPRVGSGSTSGGEKDGRPG